MGPAGIGAILRRTRLLGATQGVSLGDIGRYLADRCSCRMRLVQKAEEGE
jgi:hypothetical protein